MLQVFRNHKTNVLLCGLKTWMKSLMSSKIFKAGLLVVTYIRFLHLGGSTLIVWQCHKIWPQLSFKNDFYQLSKKVPCIAVDSNQVGSWTKIKVVHICIVNLCPFYRVSDFHFLISHFEYHSFGNINLQMLFDLSKILQPDKLVFSILLLFEMGIFLVLMRIENQCRSLVRCAST